MTDPTFRLAGPADAAALAEFMRRTFRETYSERHHGDARDADVEAYVAEAFGPDVQRAELDDPSVETHLAEIDGRLAAYAQLRRGAATPVRPGTNPVELARLYVDRPWHGSGLAGALVSRLVARAADADPLWLGVYATNARARAFYAKCGFVAAGRGSFRMGDDVQDDMILVLEDRAALARDA